MNLLEAAQALGLGEGERPMWRLYDRCCHGGRSSLPPRALDPRLLAMLTCPQPLLADLPFRYVKTGAPSVTFRR